MPFDVSSRSEWQIPASEGDGPFPRQRHAVTVCGGELYLFGGSSFLDDGETVCYHNDLYRLKDEGNVLRWTKIKVKGRTPSARDGNKICSHNNQIYLFGGNRKPDALTCLPGLYIFDIGLQRWQYAHTQGPSPPTLDHSMTATGVLAFVFGGFMQGAAVNNLTMLHLLKLTWTILKTSGQPPAPRCDHAAVAIRDRIYIHGGCGGPDHWFNDLHILDTCTLSWSRPEMNGRSPAARGCHSLVAHKKTLYVLGGCNDSLGGRRGVFGDLYSIKTGQWHWEKMTSCGRYGEDRHSQSTVVLHGQVLVFGGSGYSDDLGDMQRLRLDPKAHRKHVLRSTRKIPRPISLPTYLARAYPDADDQTSHMPRNNVKPKVHVQYIRLQQSQNENHANIDK